MLRSNGLKIGGTRIKVLIDTKLVGMVPKLVGDSTKIDGPVTDFSVFIYFDEGGNLVISVYSLQTAGHNMAPRTPVSSLIVSSRRSALHSWIHTLEQH